MNWSEWEIHYTSIKNSINLSFEKDLDAATILNQGLDEIEMEETVNQIAMLIDRKTCHIFGCGPSLEENIKQIMKKKVIKNQDVIISADGATQAFLIHDMAPDIIVTDLDGDINTIIQANMRGSIIVVHAHGDNISKIQAHVNRFKRKIGTVQVKPFGCVKNFGGFTDGDRCIFLAEHFNAKSIYLYGFDFGNIVGKYSKTEHTENFQADYIKIQKLEIAKSLIDMLKQKRNIKIINCTKHYVDSTGNP